MLLLPLYALEILPFQNFYVKNSKFYTTQEKKAVSKRNLKKTSAFLKCGTNFMVQYLFTIE